MSEQPPATEGEVEEYVSIPGLPDADAALVQSLLAGAGLPHQVRRGLGHDAIVIAVSDLPEIKEFLADYRITLGSGAQVPIPWYLVEGPSPAG